MAEIARGGDYSILIYLKDGSDVAIPVSSLLDLEIRLYQIPIGSRAPIQTWIMSDSQVEVVNGAGGIVRVYVDRAKTRLLKIMECKLETTYVYTDTNYADNKRRVPVPDIDLANTVNSTVA